MFKQKSDPAAANTKIEPADAVRLARVKARQRLIGAVVLLGIGILGFPLVFETQPRPIPVDIPIEIPRREALPPLTMPPARTPSVSSGRAPADAVPATPASTPAARVAAVRASEPVVVESSAEAGREVPAPPKPAASSPRVATAKPATPAPASAPVPSAVASTKPPSSDGERARALLEGRSTASPEEQRFVVQVGAFADADAAREARKHAEKLGLKTYTQVAQTPSGSRIRVRVGPFVTRGEAEAALAKAKAAGLGAVLLTL